MSRDRGTRRAQKASILDRFRRVVRLWNMRCPGSPEWAERTAHMLASHGKLKSDCMCCCNPRLYGELTIQERRADLDSADQE